jgi:DNA polymerase II small subunit/DNA polymerase delta subunit B
VRLKIHCLEAKKKKTTRGQEGTAQPINQLAESHTKMSKRELEDDGIVEEEESFSDESEEEERPKKKRKTKKRKKRGLSARDFLDVEAEEDDDEEDEDMGGEGEFLL